jgi:hypothetical protein
MEANLQHAMLLRHDVAAASLATEVA